MSAAIINGYVPKRMRRWGGWNQNRAILGEQVVMPIANRDQIAQFARETDMLVGNVPSAIAEGLTLTSVLPFGVAIGNPQITGAARDQDFTFAWTMSWDTPTGMVFELGSSSIGMSVRWASTTSLAVVVDDGVTATSIAITLTALQRSPVQLMIAFDVSSGELQSWVDGVSDSTATVGATPTWAGGENGLVGDISGSAVGGESAPFPLAGCGIADPGVFFYANQLPASF